MRRFKRMILVGDVMQWLVSRETRISLLRPTLTLMNVLKVATPAMTLGSATFLCRLVIERMLGLNENVRNRLCGLRFCPLSVLRTLAMAGSFILVLMHSLGPTFPCSLPLVSSRLIAMFVLVVTCLMTRHDLGRMVSPLSGPSLFIMCRNFVVRLQVPVFRCGIPSRSPWLPKLLPVVWHVMTPLVSVSFRLDTQARTRPDVAPTPMLIPPM